MDQHIRIHYAIQCNFCGKKFHDRKDLFLHLDILHHGSNSIQCNFCKMFFKRQRGLRKHMKKCPEALQSHEGQIAKKSKSVQMEPAINHYKIPKIVGSTKKELAVEKGKNFLKQQKLPKPILQKNMSVCIWNQQLITTKSQK